MKRRISEPIVSATKATVDVSAWAVGLYMAAWVRLNFSFGQFPNRELLGFICIAFATQVAIGVVVGLYRFRWVYGSFDEVAALTTTTSLATLALFVFDSTRTPRPVPKSVVLAGGLGALACMTGARYLVRLLRERWRRPDPNHPDAIRTLVFGAGDAGEQIIRAMQRDKECRYVPVGMLDDDPSKRRLSYGGVRVLGTRDSLEEVVDNTRATALLIAAPSAEASLVNDLQTRADRLGDDFTVKVLPATGELLDGNVDVGDIRDVSEVDLLGRHQIETNIEEIAGYLRGKRVLVTGAGGSIGSELCRQIHRFSPAALMMLDRDESGLHGVQLSIEGRALLDSPNLILADIRDAGRVGEIWAERRPQVVFHAAALKHLTLLERYPEEAIKTNVIGSLNVLEASVQYGVERFVNISTDKAANPTSVLGFSKRVAERLTAHFSQSAEGRFLSVRFGNVLGSRGSFIHAFRAQIEIGGPVTVTDREVTRYFMTIPEAVQLVIQAGANGGGGDVLVLDMGTPVKIADVARRMIKKSRKDVKIVYTGLRPGEKLDEVLADDREKLTPTSHPLITKTTVVPVSPGRLLGMTEAPIARLKAWVAAETPNI